MGRIRWRGREVGSTKEGDTNGTCSEIECGDVGCVYPGDKRGSAHRRTHARCWNCGILSGYSGGTRDVEDGKRKETADVHRIHSPLTRRRNEAATGDFRPTFKLAASMFGLICRVNKKVVAAHLFPTWYNVDFSCLRWSTKTLHCAYFDRHNYCWLC